MYRPKSNPRHVFGLRFDNPVGIAAADKNAEHVDVRRLLVSGLLKSVQLLRMLRLVMPNLAFSA